MFSLGGAGMMVIFCLRNCCSTPYLGSRPNTQPQHTEDKSDDAAGNIRSQISWKFLISCKLSGTVGFNHEIFISRLSGLDPWLWALSLASSSWGWSCLATCNPKHGNNLLIYCLWFAKDITAWAQCVFERVYFFSARLILSEISKRNVTVNRLTSTRCNPFTQKD